MEVVHAVRRWTIIKLQRIFQNALQCFASTITTLVIISTIIICTFHSVVVVATDSKVIVTPVVVQLSENSRPREAYAAKNDCANTEGSKTHSKFARNLPR